MSLRTNSRHASGLPPRLAEVDAVSSAATPATAAPRLIKPNIGPVLAAWVAEKPDSREAHVEIRWNLGTLEVWIQDSAASAHNFRCTESTPGSFTVSDADSRALIAEIAAKAAPPICEPTEEEVTEPLVRPEQWVREHFVSPRPPDRKCYFAAQLDQDVVSSVALWVPYESDPRWFLWAVDWSVPDFIEAVARDNSCTLHMDKWNSHATMLSLANRGVSVAQYPFGKSVRAAGINFIRNVVKADALRHAGPASAELGEALAASQVNHDEFGNPFVSRIGAPVGAFLMAAAVAYQEISNETT
jgi:hypothetical protein